MGQTKTIVFTHNMSLVDMIAAGKYDSVNDQFIEENFPRRTQGTPRLPRLFSFGIYLGTYQVLNKLRRIDLRPATLAELLYFGATHPEEKGDIVAFDEGQHCWPVIGSNNGQRRLDLLSGAYGWSASSRFAVVDL
jgi:hypothetical protein